MLTQIFTEEQLEELLYIPKYLGEPFYPGGFPFQPDSFSLSTEIGMPSKSIRERINEYYRVCVTEEGKLLPEPPLSDDDFQVLRQWAIYLVHAPIWTLHATEEFEQLKAQALAVTNWAELDEVAHLALDFGLDPL
ncbi:hypothetical protein G8759_19885 [Spirosoma aureum]|uniref:Uncharacterized protein n=1 Tax=Spirosoma aureum TaxID=2692134 RepID=A0A6G9AQE5_9BACT|nr:hypothetical protein [Spirosoma aureum]QIP14712.1 hypothetical protein G8759_19885 [Spirosoma aureum]